MSELLERFASKATRQRQNAVAQYRELLDRSDNPRAGDETKLAEVMAELGIGPADVQRHHHARLNVARLERQVRPGADLDALVAAQRDARAAAETGVKELMKTLIDRLDPTQILGCWNYLSTWVGLSVDSSLEKQKAVLLDGAATAELRATSARRDSDAAFTKIEELKRANAIAFGE